jgi:hypothetical protein
MYIYKAIDILRFKKTLTEMKNSPEGLKIRCQPTEERTSKLKNMSEKIQCEE